MEIFLLFIAYAINNKNIIKLKLQICEKSFFKIKNKVELWHIKMR